MSTRTSYAIIGIWIGVIAIAATIGALLGAPMTMAMALLVVIVGLVPPAVMLKLWNSAPTESVAEMLRSTDRQG